ncbi:MAG: hypothetical protein IJK06_04885 [Clostridia bacterium]|nr:hypothetical protein [Clostridia bacterium]
MKKLIVAILLLAMLFSVALAEETLPDLSNISVGDVITFGHYEQDNNPDNGAEPIEWIVLDVQGGRALLLSKYGLDAKPFHSKLTGATWETCTLRAWLNSDFLNAAFNAEEQSLILITDVDNGSDQGYKDWDSSGGNNTQDRIFLLSYYESNQYLGVKFWQDEDANKVEARVAPTEYAVSLGADTSTTMQTAEGEATVWWWLRSPGEIQSVAACVTSGGSLRNSGLNADGCADRPAFWLNLNPDI